MYGCTEVGFRAAYAATLAEKLSEQAKRERAKAGRAKGGKATPEQKQDRLETTVSSKRSSVGGLGRSRKSAAATAKVSERKVRYAAKVKQAKRERAKAAGRVGGQVAGRGREKKIGLGANATPKPIDRSSKSAVRAAATNQRAGSDRKADQVANFATCSNGTTAGWG